MCEYVCVYYFKNLYENDGVSYGSMLRKFVRVVCRGTIFVSGIVYIIQKEGSSWDYIIMAVGPVQKTDPPA